MITRIAKAIGVGIILAGIRHPVAVIEQINDAIGVDILIAICEIGTGPVVDILRPWTDRRSARVSCTQIEWEVVAPDRSKAATIESKGTRP